MRRELKLGLIMVLVVAFFIIPVSAVNPHVDGPGQPNADCEALFGGDLLPPGFNTEGFANAAEHYAGSGFTRNGDNPKAVSQYDVACLQQYLKLWPPV